MSDGFDVSELDKYTKDMLDFAQNTMPKETKAFIRREGNKLKRATLSNAKRLVNEKDGKYHTSIKRGKLYKYNGSLAIRVYSYDPKAHLLENGHRIVTHNGIEKGFVPGKKIFSKSYSEYSQKYVSNAEKFVDDVFKKGLL